MATYYVAQYMMGKGGLTVAEYFEKNKLLPEQEQESTPEVANNVLRT